MRGLKIRVANTHPKTSLLFFWATMLAIIADIAHMVIIKIIVFLPAHSNTTRHPAIMQTLSLTARNMWTVAIW